LCLDRYLIKERRDPLLDVGVLTRRSYNNLPPLQHFRHEEFCDGDGDKDARDDEASGLPTSSKEKPQLISRGQV